VKVALLGGGGFRTPLTIGAFHRAAPRLGLHEVALHDVDAARLDTMCRVVNAMLSTRCGPGLTVSATTNLATVLQDASYVLCAIRVGGLHARAVDERLAIEAGLVGQETVGAGGLCLAMRSVTVISAIAEQVARIAPNAWLINLTNPVGPICGVLRETLGERVIGVCDTPADLVRRVAGLLDRSVDSLRFDYFGLNHLGWLRSIYDEHRDLLPRLLDDEARLSQLHESRLFGAECLRALRMLPIDYLTYYYFPERHLDAVSNAGYSRAEYLLRQQQDFYSTATDPREDPFRLWRAARAERDRSYLSDAGLLEAPRTTDNEADGYASIALAVVESLATDVPSRAIVDVANGATLPFLPRVATVEVPCTIDARGASPCSIDVLPEHASSLMQRVQVAEQGALQAARTGSRADAVASLASHPLIASTERAARLFDAYLDQQPELATQFG
jgi:6-phospho-beta-glucosidase